MSCNCRAGRTVSSRTVVPPKITSSASRSLCPSIESEGNNVTVTVGADGRLYIGVVPVPSALVSHGCRGPFAQALLAAHEKMLLLYSTPTSRSGVSALLPAANVKLGFLRDILRSF